MADSNILTLTQAENTQAKLVLYTAPVASKDGLSISFDFYAYGGTGGDGIGFLLLDGSRLPSGPGGFGGSLGYAPLLNSNQPGIEGGYLGIGFDEFGNFSSTSASTSGQERPDGPGQKSDSVAVRGSQEKGYLYLQGTDSLTIPGTSTPFSLDNPGPTATRENSKRTAKIDLSPQGQLTISLDFNGDGDAVDAGEQLFSLNVIDAGNGALPERFAFGFAGSTGAATNVHEVGNFQINTFGGTPIPGNFTDGAIIFANPGSGSGSGPTSDPLTGTDGGDILVGSSGKDVKTGGDGADRFVFSGATKQLALRSSTLRNLDRITDFNQREGDRVQLDFDKTLSTVELPKRVFNAGKLRGNLQAAARQAYADKDFKKKGKQVLRPNEAVFFRLGNQTYLSVNDNKRAFSPQNDLLVNVSGISFKPGDLNRGTLVTSNYFA